MSPPHVSVVMAVYNGEAHLQETVISILSQTFTDFEFLIIDDGSTDGTVPLLRDFDDPRLTLLYNEQNEGLAFSLNKGLRTAKGHYIARIDAGDLALPERLEKQVNFLDAHPEVGIVGTACVILDEGGNPVSEKRFPPTDLEIRWMSLLSNPFLHPSVMVRLTVLRQHHVQYDPGLRATQDYDLWTRLLKYTQGANLADVLIRYRKSASSITTHSRTLQLNNHDRVAFRTIRETLPEFHVSQEEVSQLRRAFAGGSLQTRERKEQRVNCAGLYLDLLRAFVTQYAKSPGIKNLQRHETVRIALMGVRLPRLSSWGSILKRAFWLYPGSIFPVLGYIIQKHLWKKGRRTVYHFFQKSYHE